MTRVLAAAALAAALVAGTARADVFAVAPQSAAPAPLVLPSAETPNLPGSLVLPPAWTERASAPITLEFGRLQALWMRAGSAYGIQWQVLAAINKIETNFGGNMGPSSAGAVGWMQFMPETWLRWGTDGDGDGLADPWDPEDAVYAAARYLAAAGGQVDLPRAVYAYNHADWYVRDVLDLAGLFGRAGSDVLFTLDRMGADLERAEQLVVAANQRLVRSVREERRLGRIEARLLARADAARLLSDELELRKRAVQVGVRRAGVQETIADLRAGLETAEAELEQARLSSQAAAFAPGAAPLLASPSYGNGYVFPVGGGAAVVSVAEDHHDYPAVDIAAPAGSPVYAFADAVVERAWRLPDARCGIGATLRTADGRIWTYCHLAYLDPTVEEGGVVSAGAPVGLVGSTGHSTGPHLHLQLRPATTYPQDEPWFRSFAGSAFRWQGAGPDRAMTAANPTPAPAAAPAPVFAVVQGAADDEAPVVVFTPRRG